jgi:hypothetical protein
MTYLLVGFFNHAQVSHPAAVFARTAGSIFAEVRTPANSDPANASAGWLDCGLDCSLLLLPKEP